MFDIQEELKKMPDKPGVYIMKDDMGTIIYVGKAVILKNRVRQYFQNSANHTPKVQVMVSRISEFEYIVTDTELEALILECNLIKKHKPRYNILLKDDKNYPYIKVTMNEDYPRIYMTRRVEKDGARYYGPYSNVTVIKETIWLLKKVFPIKSCKKVFPRDIGKSRPCLNYHIHQCLGPCSGNVDREDYRLLMKDVCAILEGRQGDIGKKLEAQMNEAAERLEFEKAALYRNRLNSLRQIAEKQKVLTNDEADRDVAGIARDETGACIQVFFVRGGKLLGREHFIFDGVVEEDSRELMSTFIKQFYSEAAFVPGEILIQEDAEDSEVLEEWLGSKRGGRVRISVPKRGSKLQLIEMVSQNAQLALKQSRERQTAEGSVAELGLQALVSVLELTDTPARIEAYDISNTGTSEITASMVVFAEGKPDKDEYRRYRIKSLDIQNDYAAMQEVIFRRFRRLKASQPLTECIADKAAEDNATGNGEMEDSAAAARAAIPDLLLIDGGAGHVSTVRQVLDELGVNIPVAGMVKDDRHRTRGLAYNGRVYELAGNAGLLRFVTSIQDEAHRFATAYNKKLREKRYTESALDSVPGIGPQRKKELLKHFGSVKAIREAGVDDLAAVKGISNAAAESIYNHFRTNSITRSN
ncbi:MAG: excinuclease ABC subunit UvrC [Clostridiales bacterium]|nr:excinuclease ABC subunit UvrC [Clostridiales bacterium]